MTKARIIADSVSPSGKRITTWILTYPRFIHAEFMTHRVFSRNAASSRAIPTEKILKAIEDNPAMPEFWGANQSGMQAAVELAGNQKDMAMAVWSDARLDAISRARHFNRIGLHKQIANRVTEPWSHITVLATATEYLNFFSLRAHKDAQPEFQVLAYTMLREYLSNVQTLVAYGDWHIPFGDKMPEGLTLSEKLKVATARAARISYNTFDGVIDLSKDYELHDRLAQSGHWSPFEHCARCDKDSTPSNFVGWTQYRKQFHTENPTNVNLHEILNNIPEWVSLAIEQNQKIKS